MTANEPSGKRPPSVRAGADSTGNWPRRRGRAALVGVILAAAASATISWTVFTGVGVRHCGPAADYGDGYGGKPSRRWITPEYDRYMKKLVISLAERDTSLARQHEILLRVPDYTEIILLLPKSNLEVIRRELKGRPYHRQVRLVSYGENIQEAECVYLLFPEKDKLVQIDVGEYDLPGQQGTLWAQDLFEVMTHPDGQITLLASEVYKWYRSTGPRSDLQVVRDNVYLGCLSTAGMKVQAIPLVFMGGNLLVDELAGRRIVFCGGDILRTTRTAGLAIGEKDLSDSGITSVIRNVLNADEVVVIGADRVQPSSMYHLDQAMILLPHKTAGVARIVGERSTGPSNDDKVVRAKRFLSDLRATLRRLGYKLIDIDMTARDLLHCRHYVNAIPYKDARTGRRMLLMPIFPSDQTDFDRELVRKNTASFEALGYEVVAVPTKANELRGGIHCLVNVLE